MNIEIEKAKLKKFIKTGIFVLGCIAIAGTAFYFIPKAISVSSSSSKKELPIYCVDTEEKKVGLSFDAAWGDGRVRKIIVPL